jgi:hypothetical protein
VKVVGEDDNSVDREWSALSGVGEHRPQVVNVLGQSAPNFIKLSGLS